MNKEFANYEQSLALKKLGFKEDVLAWYDTENKLLNTGSLWQLFKNDDDFVLAPLKSQVFRWFREKYGLYHIIHCASEKIALFTITNMINEPSVHTDRHIETYEEAENACIDKLIEIAKQQDNEQRVINK